MFYYLGFKNIKLAGAFVLLLLAVINAGIFFRGILLPDEASILIVLSSVIFVPGFFLFELFLKQNSDFNPVEIIPVIFCLSLGFWAIPAFIGFNLHLPIDLFVVLAIFLIAIYSMWKLFFQKTKKRIVQSLTSNGTLWIFLVSTFIVSSAVYLSARFHRIDFDTFFHIAWMQNIAQGGRLDGYTDPFTGMATLAPYINNLWFFVIGLVSYLSHIEVVRIYPLLAGILSCCAIAVFYSFVKHIFRDAYFAVLTSILFIGFWFLFSPLWDFNRIFFKNLFFVFLPYPADLLCLIVFPVASISYLRFILSGDRGDMIVAGLLTFVVATLHVSFIFYLGLVFLALLGASAICRTCFKPQLKNYFLLAIILLLVGIFTCFFRLPLLKNTSNYLSDMTSLKAYVAGRVGYWEFGRYFVMPDPVYYFQKAPWNGLALLGLVIIFFKRKGGDFFRTLFLAIGFVLPLLLLFNPVLAPLLSKILTVTVYRRIGLYSHQVFVYTALFSAIAMLFIRPKFTSSQGKKESLVTFRNWIIPAVFISSAVIMLILPFSRRILFNSVTNHKNFVDIQYIGYKPLFVFLKNDIPKEAVVAANPDYAYLISAITGHRVIAIMTTRMSDYKEADLRTEENRKIVEFDGSAEEIVKLLEKYHCRYIVLNHQDKTLGKYKSLSKDFKIVFDSGEWTVFLADYALVRR